MAGLLATGCPHEKYTLAMRVKKDAVHRKLTVTRQSDPKGVIDAAELLTIAKLYRQPAATQPVGERSFEGWFTGELPSDLGGTGQLVHYETRLGTLSVYAEEIRGDDDAIGVLEHRITAANAVTDHLLAWLKQDFGRHREFRRLERFLDARFRRDLKNLAFYLWQLGNAHVLTPPTQSGRYPVVLTTSIRIALYFYKRGYFSQSEIAHLTTFRGFNPWTEATRSWTERTITRLGTDLIGLRADGLAGELARLLSDPHKASRSLAKYARSTKQWRQIVRDARRATPRAAPKALAILSTHFETLLPTILTRGASDALDSHLVTDVEPLYTNGTWDPKTRAVAWQREIDERRPRYGQLPLLCYAVWANPTAETQKKQMGRVVLEGRPLARYILARASLPEEAGQQWDAWLDSVTSAAELRDRVGAIRRQDAEKRFTVLVDLLDTQLAEPAVPRGATHPARTRWPEP